MHPSFSIFIRKLRPSVLQTIVIEETFKYSSSAMWTSFCIFPKESQGARSALRWLFLRSLKLLCPEADHIDGLLRVRCHHSESGFGPFTFMALATAFVPPFCWYFTCHEVLGGSGLGASGLHLLCDVPAFWFP